VFTFGTGSTVKPLFIELPYGLSINWGCYRTGGTGHQLVSDVQFNASNTHVTVVQLQGSSSLVIDNQVVGAGFPNGGNSTTPGRLIDTILMTHTSRALPSAFVGTIQVTVEYGASSCRVALQGVYSE